MRYLILALINSHTEFAVNIIECVFKLRMPIMLRFLVVWTAALATASPTLDATRLIGIDHPTKPVANLGSAGSYMGIVQNNGTYAVLSILRCLQYADIKPSELLRGREFLMHSHRSESYASCHLKL